MPVQYGSLPFLEAIAFLRAKLNLPTEHWDDILGAAHDRAFVVAGATKADLLNDLHRAVEKAIGEGQTLRDFRKNFEEIVANRGWTGWTGEGTKAGRAWRARVIYDTNLFTSYSAGRHRQMKAVAEKRPYWRYRHSPASVVPRAEHLAWDGMILRHDNPWWKTHSPPNGFGCKCFPESLAERDLKKHDLAVTPDDQIPYNRDVEKVNRATGEVYRVPEGVDRGWDYAPGANADQDLADLIATKRNNKWPPELQKAFDALMSKKGISDAAKPALAFEEHTSAKAAAQWAMENDLVSFADYGKLAVPVVNDVNKSLFEHIRDFPLLRKNQDFIGSAQKQYQRYYDLEVERLAGVLRKHYPDASESALRAQAMRLVKKPKVDGRSYAHSWTQKNVVGIAVNEKYGANAKTIVAMLRSDVESTWHPVGTASVKAVVDHELGHQLDHLLSLGKDREVISLWEANQAGMEQALSGYAKTNINEFIAEAWAEYRNNPAPRGIAKSIGRIVTERYKDAARKAAATTAG